MLSLTSAKIIMGDKNTATISGTGTRSITSSNGTTLGGSGSIGVRAMSFGSQATSGIRSFGNYTKRRYPSKSIRNNYSFGKSTRIRERTCTNTGVVYNLTEGQIAQYYDETGQLKQAIGLNETTARVEDIITSETELTLVNKTLENVIITGQSTYDTGVSNQESIVGSHHITTTNNTATTLYTRDIEDDSNYLVEYTIIGQSVGDKGTWKGSGLVTSTSATITNTTYIAPSHDGWNVTLGISSGTFSLQVTGKLLERVYWTGTVRVTRSNLNEDLNSVTFDDNGYLTIAADIDLKIDSTTSGSFSISAMFIPTIAQTSVILCKEVLGVTGSSGVTLQMISDLTVRLMIFSGTTTQEFISDEKLTLNSLNYIVWTKSGSTIKFYLNNGSPQSYTQTFSPALGAIEYNIWRIGADQSSNYAKGIIRSVAIYSDALSETEVEEVAEYMGDPTSTSITSGNILAYWPLDETESTSGFADDSGNGHTAIEVGTLTFVATNY
jgi:hypothetical protein